MTVRAAPSSVTAGSALPKFCPVRVIWLVSKFDSTLTITGFCALGVAWASDEEDIATRYESARANKTMTFLAVFICFSIYEVKEYEPTFEAPQDCSIRATSAQLQRFAHY